MKNEYVNTILNYIDGNIPISDFENWIYNTNDLEKYLSKSTYFSLLEINYNNEKSTKELKRILLEEVITEGDFYTWKIKNKLLDFINQPEKVKEHLDDIYDLSIGIYPEKGELLEGFAFLSILGLKYVYWMDEAYLKINYGDNWKLQYEKYKVELKSYHSTLKPIAKNILEAIEEGAIKIIGRGEYDIIKEF